MTNAMRLPVTMQYIDVFVIFVILYSYPRQAVFDCTCFILQNKSYLSRIESLRLKDIEKQELQKVQNELESFAVEAQDRLYQPVYEKCSTEEEREQIRTAMSEASDWLYEQDEKTPTQVRFFIYFCVIFQNAVVLCGFFSPEFDK